MKWLLPGIVITALATSPPADAHAHLLSSSPTNHSTLSVAPQNLTLEFKEAVRLTAAAIERSDAKPLKIASLPAAASRLFALPLPALGPGTYAITWRAASGDGHVMSGTIQFTVQPGAVPAAK